MLRSLQRAPRRAEGRGVATQSAPRLAPRLRRAPGAPAPRNPKPAAAPQPFFSAGAKAGMLVFGAVSPLCFGYSMWVSNEKMKTNKEMSDRWKQALEPRSGAEEAEAAAPAPADVALAEEIQKAQAALENIRRKRALLLKEGAFEGRQGAKDPPSDDLAAPSK